MRLLLLFLAFNLISCASYFKRKDCESTNWFEYGQNIALEGRRLTGDKFISECYNAEADVAESDLDRGFKSGLEKYCQPETVFQIGKNGNFFSTEMCTGQGVSTLLSKHRAGVGEYCVKSNGYAAGTKGKAYNKICPADLETSFLPEFNRGRKRYLGAVIAENQKEINQAERELGRLQSELGFKKAQLMRHQYNTKDEKMMNVVNELSSQVRNLEYAISSKQSQINKLQNDNRSMQLEIVQLGN